MGRRALVVPKPDMPIMAIMAESSSFVASISSPSSAPPSVGTSESCRAPGRDVSAPEFPRTYPTPSIRQHDGPRARLYPSWPYLWKTAHLRAWSRVLVRVQQAGLVHGYGRSHHEEGVGVHDVRLDHVLAARGRRVVVGHPCGHPACRPVCLGGHPLCLARKGLSCLKPDAC